MWRTARVPRCAQLRGSCRSVFLTPRRWLPLFASPCPSRRRAPRRLSGSRSAKHLPRLGQLSHMPVLNSTHAPPVVSISSWQQRSDGRPPNQAGPGRRRRRRTFGAGRGETSPRPSGKRLHSTCSPAPGAGGPMPLARDVPIARELRSPCRFLVTHRRPTWCRV